MKTKVLFLCSVFLTLSISGCSNKPQVVSECPNKPQVVKKQPQNDTASCNMPQQSEYKTVPFE